MVAALSAARATAWLFIKATSAVIGTHWVFVVISPEYGSGSLVMKSSER